MSKPRVGARAAGIGKSKRHRAIKLQAAARNSTPAKPLMIQPRGEPELVVKTPGRNDPCSCDSKKKFKYCCGKPA